MTTLARVLIFVVVAMAGTRTAYGQNAPAQRVEIGVALGMVRPEVVMNEPGGLRERPFAVDSGDSHSMRTPEVFGRVWWNHLTHTTFVVGLPAESVRAYDFPRPLTPPGFPFTTYTSRSETNCRQRSIALSQLFDLVRSGRVIPFMGAGMEFRSVSRTQRDIGLNYVTLAGARDSSSVTDGSQRAGFATAGVRFLAGRHGAAFVEGVGYVHTSETEDPGLNQARSADSIYGAISWRLRAGAGVRF